MKDRTIFTICSRNYLHFARTLMDSLKGVADSSDKYILLVDKLLPGDKNLSLSASCPVIPVETIGIPHLHQMLFRYNIMEANTAVKPFFIQWLLDKGYKKVIYFDPDIFVYQPLEELFDLLDDQDVILIPHLTEAIKDDKKPGELDIIQAGTYNLGFIAVKDSSNVKNLLNWWAPKLINNCLVKVSDGIFVDQKWIDLVPGMFDRVYILRDDTYDVAYWNLAHRPLTMKQGKPRVRGKPLVFFHFSGLNPRYPKYLSRHQNRHILSDFPVVKKLVLEYIQTLKTNGLKKFSACKYAFDEFSDGTPILAIFRKIYLENPELVNIAGDNPFENKKVLYTFINQPVDNELPVFTRFAKAIYQQSPDLQKAFPNPRDNHGAGYLNWFVDKVPRKYGAEKALIAPTRESMGNAESTNSRNISNKTGYFAGHSLYRLAYRHKDHHYFYWVSPNARQKIKRVLLKISSSLLKHSEAPGHSYPSSHLPRTGVNVAAYVSANLGLGEAGRMVIRSLNSCQVDTRIIDCSREEKDTSLNPAWPLHNEFHYKASIFAVNADRTLWAHEVYRPRFKGRHYNIGFWNWELPEWPDRWCSSFGCVDEVWAPSSFCREAIAEKSPVPVITMPYCIDPANMETNEAINRSYFSLPDDRFIFFYMFDVRSFIERKNPLGVIEAFKMAFPPSHRQVHLVIKLNNSFARSSSLKLLEESVKNSPNITIMNKALDRKTLNSLISLTDCYVSLHRSEGFGFPLAEAMYLKKPVIATQWSGNVDFMNKHNSFQVGYRLTEIKKDIGPYRKGQLWAEPDLPEAAHYMTKVYEDINLRNAIAKRAHHYISAELNPVKVGNLYIQRLKQVGVLENGYQETNRISCKEKNLTTREPVAGIQPACAGMADREAE